MVLTRVSEGYVNLLFGCKFAVMIQRVADLCFISSLKNNSWLCEHLMRMRMADWYDWSLFGTFWSLLNRESHGKFHCVFVRDSSTWIDSHSHDPFAILDRLVVDAVWHVV